MKKTLTKKKVLVPGWMLDVFDEYGIDTSGYITDGRLSSIEEFSDEVSEPKEASPCPLADVEPVGDNLELSEELIDYKLEPPEEIKFNTGLERVYYLGKITDRIVKTLFIISKCGKVRIRSPSQRPVIL